MSRWLSLVGFVAVVSILGTLVVSAFVFDVRHVARAPTGMKDCFGSIPEELKVLRGYIHPAIEVSAKHSPSTASFAPIALGKTASIIFPVRASRRTDQITEPEKSKNAAKSSRYSGFTTFEVDDDGYYRIAAAQGIIEVKVTSDAAPSSPILPEEVGHIACELNFVSDYHLDRGNYIMNVISNGPNGNMIIIPRATKWESSWNFVDPL